MPRIRGGAVRKIVVACEAGMGSSLMLVGQLRKALQGLPVQVEHAPVGRIPPDADLILCHRGLAARARQVAPERVVLSFDTFVNSPVIQQVVDAVRGDQWLEA